MTLRFGSFGARDPPPISFDSADVMESAECWSGGMDTGRNGGSSLIDFAEVRVRDADACFHVSTCVLKFNI